MNKRLVRLLWHLWLPLAVIAVYWIYSTSANSPYWPSPPEMATAFWDNWVFERSVSDLVPSLVRFILGLSLGAGLGLMSGVLLGLSTKARRALFPVTEFIRSLPKPALIPVSMVLLGVGTEQKVAIIAFACVWPVFLNTVDGVRGVESTVMEMVQVYRIFGWRRLTRVTLPAATPQIFSGLRVALALGLLMMVFAEMFGSSNGLGYFIVQSQRLFAISDMWSGILLLGLLGFVVNALYLLVERRVLRWHRGWRASLIDE